MPKLQICSVSTHRIKYLIYLFPWPIFAPVYTSNKTTKQIAAFGLLWGMLFYKYIQTYINVRCTLHAQPVSLLTYGLHLTSKGRGAIFKLLHKLIFKCLITYFSVFNHGEHFQIKAHFQKSIANKNISLSFSHPSIFGKITSYYYRSLANLVRLLIACIIYF